MRGKDPSAGNVDAIRGRAMHPTCTTDDVRLECTFLSADLHTHLSTCSQFTISSPYTCNCRLTESTAMSSMFQSCLCSTHSSCMSTISSLYTCLLPGSCVMDLQPITVTLFWTIASIVNVLVVHTYCLY